MSTKTAVTCDGCGKDLTYATNCIEYRLHLCDVPIPFKSAIVTAMHVEPNITAPADFCGFKCLRKWANRGSSEI